LIKEFDRVLSGRTYSILPIVRLCESNPAVAEGIAANRVTHLSSMVGLAEHMLQRTADVPKGNEEVITRVGLAVGTIDGSGQPVLCRPTNPHRAQLSEVSRGTKRKLGVEDLDKKILGKLAVLKLKELATAENVVLPEKARLVKADYIDAIYQSRTLARDHARGEVMGEEKEDAMDVADGVSDKEKEEVIVAKEQEAMADEEVLSKKFLYVNSVTELMALAAKENIVIKPGVKKKIDYVDAIYLARNPPST